MHVFAPHFEKIYNNKEREGIDVTGALDMIEQREVMEELANDFTLEDLQRELRKAKNYKAPGRSGVPNEAMKSLNKENQEELLEILNREFQGVTETDGYKIATLKCLYKMKGDDTDPNKWRGICLKETTARILSGMIGHRLLKIIHRHGPATQFGHIGCTEGLFTLRAALQTCRYHNQETHALFVDLVKAFDTANHRLMLKILERYGAPKKLAQAIQRIYRNVRVQLTIGKEKKEIPYTIGVQQGDNMAPLLFLLLMQAVSETLTKRWTQAGLNTLQYRTPKHLTKENTEGQPKITPRGRLVGQATKTIGIQFAVNNLLYCDDGAFLFDTHQQLKEGANLLYSTFREFGLEMHIGREGVDNGKSKTEAMFFPRSLQEDLYDHEYTDMEVPVADGHVSYSRKFKYLGSWITEDLRDDEDTKARIQKATRAVGKIRHLLHDRHTSMKTKRLLYEATVVNTLIWGCESWTMADANKRRIDTFHHKNLRSIFRFTMHDVKNHGITNRQLRAWFDEAMTPSEMVTLRQAHWIRKLAKMSLEKTPTVQLLLAWTDHPRKPGHPQKNYKNAYANTIAKILLKDPKWEKTAKAQDWMEEFRQDARFVEKLRTWKESTIPAPNQPLELDDVLRAIKKEREEWRATQAVANTVTVDMERRTISEPAWQC